jgi:hypothetical protein
VLNASVAACLAISLLRTATAKRFYVFGLLELGRSLTWEGRWRRITGADVLRFFDTLAECLTRPLVVVLEVSRSGPIQGPMRPSTCRVFGRAHYTAFDAENEGCFTL